MIQQDPRVSVIMRCKNSDWVIGQALAGLFSQSFDDFELIVVDSGSRDKTLDIVRQYPCQLIEIEAARYFPGSVLNMAAARARGELLVFQNSDTVPLTPFSLQRLVDAFNDSQVQAAFGRQAPRPEALPWVRRDYAIALPASGPAPPWMKLSLPFAAMRRNAWKQRPFYEESWASEDTEWGHWARRSGWTIRYVPEALAMHSHNYTLSQIYGRRYVEGEADAFIYGGGDRLAAMLRRAAASLAHDLAWHVRSGDWRGAWSAPMRRAVCQWAYYRGRSHGHRRRLRGDTDAAPGQRIALQRHDAK